MTDEEIKTPFDDYKKTVASFFVLARVYKDKYDALISVGFTKEEALDIIKARGINP